MFHIFFDLHFKPYQLVRVSTRPNDRKVFFLRSVLHHFSFVKRSEFGDSELVGFISCTRVPNEITEFAEIENRSRDHFPPKTKLYFGI